MKTEVRPGIRRKMHAGPSFYLLNSLLAMELGRFGMLKHSLILLGHVFVSSGLHVCPDWCAARSVLRDLCGGTMPRAGTSVPRTT